MNQRKKVTGIVVEALPELRHNVELPDGTVIMAYTAGKMRHNKIRLIVGDRVEVELDPYGGKGTNRLTRRL